MVPVHAVWRNREQKAEVYSCQLVFERQLFNESPSPILWDQYNWVPLTCLDFQHSALELSATVAIHKPRIPTTVDQHALQLLSHLRGFQSY